MENRKNHNLITFAIIGMLVLVFGFYSSTIQYANATSVVNVTSFPAGTVTIDATYRTGIGSSDTDTTAYIVGQNGGQAYVWKKSGTTNTIIANVTLTGDSTARAIEFNEDIIAVYVATNTKFWKLTTNLGISASFASGTANLVRQMIYDDTHNILYFCTLDILGTLNQVTLSPTTVYTDAGTDDIFSCALDETNNFMYMAGDGVGGGFDVIKVSLSTFTVVDSATFPVNFGFGVCYDSSEDIVWVSESSGAIVRKYDSSLVQITTIAVGTTPRNCSISDDTGARRLYVANEGTDNVSIIEMDANIVLSTQTVCDYGTTYIKIDTKRLFNTTNTYIPCGVSSTTNRVIIDDSVSEEIPEPTFCEIPANVNLLRCVLGDDELTGVGEEVGQGISDLACNVIFANCSEDTNPATNGIGLLIFIASIFVIVGMFYYAIGTEAFHMPIFIWIIIIVALSVFFTIIGLIDPVFLVLSIIAIIALAVPKIIGVVRGGSTFGAGSTA